MRPASAAILAIASSFAVGSLATASAQVANPDSADRSFAVGQPFEAAFNDYLKLPATKAFAVAVDATGAWAGGWSHSWGTPEEAEAVALRECRRRRREHSVRADCKIIAVDGTVMRQRIPFSPARQPTQIPRQQSDPATPSSGIRYEVLWVNGTNFVVGSSGDRQVWVAFLAGRDPQALIYLANASGRSITFVPESIAAVAGRHTRKGVTRIDVRAYSPVEYEKRVRTKQAWQAALHGAAVALSNQPQPQTSTFSGGYSSYRPFQPGSQLQGTFYGQITRWPTAEDYSAAWERSAAQMQAMGDQLRASFDAMAASLMRTHTLAPGTYYGGIVHFTRFRADRVGLSIRFGDTVFQVEFTMPSRQ